jgi:pyruvate formate lyase activating enzyme
MTAEELLAQYQKNRAFYRNGGITVTGGEPLLQIDFLTELFQKAKEQGIHTCVDTSGITFTPDHTERLDRLLEVTDLVMLDIKQIDPEKHRVLTGHDNSRILAFAKHLEKKKIPLWIRHIIVKGYSDDSSDLKELGRFIGGLSNLKALDVLPYHTMGVSKYESLGIPYPLAGMPALAVSDAALAKEQVLQGIREIRRK